MCFQNTFLSLNSDFFLVIGQRVVSEELLPQGCGSGLLAHWQCAGLFLGKVPLLWVLRVHLELCCLGCTHDNTTTCGCMQLHGTLHEMHGCAFHHCPLVWMARPPLRRGPGILRDGQAA